MKVLGADSLLGVKDQMRVAPSCTLSLRLLLI